ncbi:MAG: hypothetical protein AB7H97_19745 [Pseudobdellovibrionaceae bacterium]
MRLSIIMGLGLMIVSFQNCSKTSFSTVEGAQAKASEVLVPMDTDPDSVDQNDPKKEDHGKQCDRDKDIDKENGEFVACILDGPGKSIKLGIMSDKLDGVNSVAESVCVTENACLNLVSASFKVKGVEDRGYCKHNHNVRRLSDAEVKTLLGI